MPGLQDLIHTALATLPLRGVKPMQMQQPLRDLDQVRAFMAGMGPTAFLDMPWIPIFLIALFLFHPADRPDGAVRDVCNRGMTS